MKARSAGIALGSCLFFAVLVWGYQNTGYGGTPPRPHMILLLDTADQMQYKLGASHEQLPNCNAGSGNTSRWIELIQVLTGTIKSYYCTADTRNFPGAEDNGATPAHYQWHSLVTSGPVQESDGLLDVYANDIKFGLATTEGVMNKSAAVEGAFSFGPDASNNGTDYNFGVRNESAPWGKLVKPATTEDSSAIAAVHAVIQEQINITRPYGSMSMGAALEDMLYMFQNDPMFGPYTQGGQGDPYYTCRDNAVILVTQGTTDNIPEGTYHQSALVQASGLFSEGVYVFVVGYQTDADDKDYLDEIAYYGGTTAAYFADDTDEFRYALSVIMSTMARDMPSMVDVAYTNRTLNPSDRQYRFFASYARSTFSAVVDMVGHLEQYIYRCDVACSQEGWTGGASLCDIFSIDEALNTRTDARTLYTQINGELVVLNVENKSITEKLLNIPISGSLPNLEDGSEGYYTVKAEPPTKTKKAKKAKKPKKHVGKAKGKMKNKKFQLGANDGTLGDASKNTVRREYRDQLIRLMIASPLSRRAMARMGAIIHSQPTLQPDLFSLTVPLPSFLGYRLKEDVLSRPTVLFVGTHEGFLHAFRVDRNTEELGPDDYGYELWAFMPKQLLGKANALATGAAILMDGSPVVKDLRMVKASAAQSLDAEIAAWKSIVVAGYGQGGRGYFALDVTQPYFPQFKWEISTSERCYRTNTGTSRCENTNAYSRLGYSTSTPVLGNVYFEYQTAVQERAVAIFGGGKNVGGEAQSGFALYVVDLDTGLVIKEFCNTCGNIVDDNTTSGNSSGLDCALDSEISGFDDYPGSLLTRAFVGDACGQIWRLDLRSTDPDDWRLEFFFDVYSGESLAKADQGRRRPVSNRLSLAMGAVNGRLVITGGSGDIELSLPTVLPDTVFSLSEAWDQESGRFLAETNWVKPLELGESFTSGPLVFAQTAYFTTEVPSADYCAVGTGRIWGAHYTGHDLESTEDVEAAMDLDGNYITINDIVLNKDLAESEPRGMSIIQRPSCSDAVTSYLPWAGGVEGTQPPAIPGNAPAGTSTATFGGSSQGALDLLVQTGFDGEQDSSLAPAEQESQTGNKTRVTLPPPWRSMGGTSWGPVFD